MLEGYIVRSQKSPRGNMLDGPRRHTILQGHEKCAKFSAGSPLQPKAACRRDAHRAGLNDIHGNDVHLPPGNRVQIVALSCQIPGDHKYHNDQKCWRCGQGGLACREFVEMVMANLGEK